MSMSIGLMVLMVSMMAGSGGFDDGWTRAKRKEMEMESVKGKGKGGKMEEEKKKGKEMEEGKEKRMEMEEEKGRYIWTRWGLLIECYVIQIRIELQEPDDLRPLTQPIGFLPPTPSSPRFQSGTTPRHNAAVGQWSCAAVLCGVIVRGPCAASDINDCIWVCVAWF